MQVISGDGERITCPNDDMTMAGCYPRPGGIGRVSLGACTVGVWAFGTPQLASCNTPPLPSHHAHRNSGDSPCAPALSPPLQQQA